MISFLRTETFRPERSGTRIVKYTIQVPAFAKAEESFFNYPAVADGDYMQSDILLSLDNEYIPFFKCKIVTVREYGVSEQFPATL